MYTAQRNEWSTKSSQYNTKSVRLQGYQSVHFGSTGDCKSISHVLVQMKITTGAMETKARHPPKKEWSCMCWPQTVALSLSFLTHSSLVLCSASVLVNTGSLSWYLQHNQVGSSIHAVARRFAIAREHQNSQVRDWCPILFTDEQVHTEHMW